jgi:hypothetical protein
MRQGRKYSRVITIPGESHVEPLDKYACGRQAALDLKKAASGGLSIGSRFDVVQLPHRVKFVA